jgi:hypothetical protein
MQSMDEERQRLERVFFDDLDRSTLFDAQQSVDKDASMAGHFSKLPVWAVPTESTDHDDGVPTHIGGMPLPGLQTVFGIREPGQVEAFEKGVLGGGSSVFAAVASQCGPGSVGTLMEVVSWQRLPDQLVVHALGFGRIRVDKCYNADTYALADCMVQPDEEEIQYHLPTGTGQVMAKIRKLEALSQDVLATLEDGYFQRAALLVANHAAAVWSLSWRTYEVPVEAVANSFRAKGLLDLQRGGDARDASLLRPCDIVAIDLSVNPDDTMYRARCAANAAALRYTPEALKVVGYKPMVREYLRGGGVLGAGLEDDGELMPPSWMEVIDHFEARTAADQEGSAEEGGAEQAAEDVVEDLARPAEEGAAGRSNVQQVVELEGGVVVGGRWGGQVHGRGGEELETTLLKREAEIWALLHELVESCGGGVDGSTNSAGNWGRVGDGPLSIPVELKQMHPAIAHPAWPVVRRVQRLSYAALAAIPISDLGPLRYFLVLDCAVQRHLSSQLGGRY